MKRTFSLMLFAWIFIWDLPTPAQETQAPKIGIVYTSPHPVINEIIDGFTLCGAWASLAKARAGYGKSARPDSWRGS